MYAAAARAKTATIIRAIGEVAIATTVPNAATAIAAIPPAAAIAVNIPAMGPTNSNSGPTTPSGLGVLPQPPKLGLSLVEASVELLIFELQPCRNCASVQAHMSPPLVRRE